MGADASNHYIQITVTASPAQPIPCAVNDVFAVQGALRLGRNDGGFSVMAYKDDVEVCALHAIATEFGAPRSRCQ